MDHNFFLITVHVMIFSPHIRLDIDEDEETTSGDGIDDQHEEKMRTSTNFHSTPPEEILSVCFSVCPSSLQLFQSGAFKSSQNHVTPNTLHIIRGISKSIRHFTRHLTTLSVTLPLYPSHYHLSRI